MTSIPYIDAEITEGVLLQPIEVFSSPFPLHEIPAVLVSPFFLLEECGEDYFVRHTCNSFFCLPTTSIEVEMEVMLPASDALEPEYKKEKVLVDVLVASFFGEQRTLAYAIGSTGQSFLKICSTNLNFEELPELVQKLYQAANMQMAQYLDFNDEQVRTPHMVRAMNKVLEEKFW